MWADVRAQETGRVEVGFCFLSAMCSKNSSIFKYQTRPDKKGVADDEEWKHTSSKNIRFDLRCLRRIFSGKNICGVCIVVYDFYVVARDDSIFDIVPGCGGMYY